MSEWPGSLAADILRHNPGIYSCCISCTLPMVGIFKESPDNRGPYRVAREVCWPCVKVEEYRKEQEAQGVLEARRA